MRNSMPAGNSFLSQQPRFIYSLIVVIAAALFLTGCPASHQTSGGDIEPKLEPKLEQETEQETDQEISKRTIEPSNNSSNNILDNAGFEEVTPGEKSSEQNEIVYWQTTGNVTLDEQETGAGLYAVRVEAQDSTAAITSDLFEVLPHSRLEFTGLMKAQDVVSPGSYHHLRVTLAAYAADRETKIRHWDLISTAGSFDWQKIQDAIIVPESARFIRLRLSLTECTGTFWADELSIKMIQAPISQEEYAEQSTIPSEQATIGNLFPTPWKITASGERYPSSEIAILVNHDGDISSHRLVSAVERHLAAASIRHQILPSGLTEAAAIDFVLTHPTMNSLLIISDETSTRINNALGAADPTISWADLKSEGYFLSISNLEGQSSNGINTKSDSSNQKSLLLIGANAEAGQFYGVQTLGQLIDVDQSAPGVVIVDRPTLTRRGTPVGLQWYREADLLMARLASFKFNFVWNQGTFEDQIFWYRWREPLSDSNIENISAYIELAHSHFITPFISIGPRGEDPTSATIYSSEEDIEAVVHKMEHLYALGVRHFGLSFDDLNNDSQHVLFGQDIDKFDSIGDAHTYFIDQIYQRLYAQYDDIEMMVVPMIYNGIGNLSNEDKAYLESMGGLPKEIGLYSSAVYQQDADVALELSGRPHFIWDNYWSSFYSTSNPATGAIVPLQRSIREASISGYSFMPIVPAAEDPQLITWRSAANFAWAPSR